MSSAAEKEKRSAIEILQEFSVPLISGVVVALLWANFSHHGYHAFIDTPLFGEESQPPLFRERNPDGVLLRRRRQGDHRGHLPGGALNPPRKAVNPLMGTLGGILGPIGVYFVMVWMLRAPEIANGWGMPTATDIALAWLVARLVFGARHPAVSFLLLLAVADDAAGLAIIAISIPIPTTPWRQIAR